MASERWHLRVLKEQVGLTAGPFSIICERSKMVIQSCLKIRRKAIIKKEKENLENHLLVSLTSVLAKIM